MIAINFDNLIDKIQELKEIVENGEEVILEDSGHPVAKIVPFHMPRKRILGGEAGTIWISDDFNEPLP
jgi:antitoxin (DNA-binding transcriptional repressor) of toxin-antitoxin stability system